MENSHVETQIVATGRPEHREGAPVNGPVHFTSTYYGRLDERDPAAGADMYARSSNPTWNGPEQLLAQLESVTDTSQRPALLFSSGMAAITAAIHLVPVGGRVLFPRHSYNGTGSQLDQLNDAGRLNAERFDVTDLDQLRNALASSATGTDLVWLESPTNPMLEIADVAEVVRIAHEYGALVAVDNTFATPLVQRPLELGADVVVHSVTKYLSGHSDVVLGAVVTDDQNLYETLLNHRTLFGGIAGPMEAYLALRGMRTLAVRVHRSMATAAELARRLEGLGQPENAENPDSATRDLVVRYPGLPSHEGHQLAAATMSGGFGSVLTIDTGSVEAADAVTETVQLWTPATSLGGVESLIERRRRIPSEPATVPEGLLRLSVGIEHIEDLWDDLCAGLRAAGLISSQNR